MADFTARGLNRRGQQMMLCGVFALAAIGYVVGLRAGVPEPDLPAEKLHVPARTASGDVVPAMSYADVGRGALRRTADVPLAAMIRGLLPPEGRPVTDMESRLEALERRGARRAFNGAPPTVPHPVTDLSDASCLACHEQGIAMGALRARTQPHERLTNCRQCHAPQAPGFLRAHGAPRVPSTWEGVAAPVSGQRAYEGAPPTVPHTLQMRDNCRACHGTNGWPGMQTTHPERINCLQCHAPTEDRSHPGRHIPGPHLLAPLPRRSAR